MTNEIQPNQNLFTCTVKKSWNVTQKYVLYASYAVVGMTAAILACVGAWVLFGALYPALLAIWDCSGLIVFTIWFILPSIPWYCYVIVVALAAILIYSLLWCIARNLTEDDWQSGSAKDISEEITLVLTLLVLTLLALALALAFAFALALAPLAFVFAPLAFALAFALFISKDSKAFLFIGAYLHYRKRTQKQG
jgi:hypothetical protein